MKLVSWFPLSLGRGGQGVRCSLSHFHISSFFIHHFSRFASRVSRIIILLFLLSPPLHAQGRLSGNFAVNAQYYRADSLIGAASVPQRLGAQTWMNLRYDQGDFSAGLRYEGYLSALQGFDPGYDGVGIPYYFFRYGTGDIDVTAGSFYEQFGNGLVLRAWEDKELGLDNALQGVRVSTTLVPGVKLTGLVGRQRLFFDAGEGLVRGLNGDASLSEWIPAWREGGLRLNFGGSFVNRYQDAEDPLYILPANVATWSVRTLLSLGALSIDGEYARKINDPSLDNGYIYKPGESLLINLNWAVDRLGIHLSARRTDNMSFRSDRNQSLNRLMINNIPAITRNYTYSLMTLYPYATQLNGEMGLHGELTWQLREGSAAGGKYGTLLTLNFTVVNDIVRNPVVAYGDTLPSLGRPGTLGYQSPFFGIGEEKLHRDLSLEISRRLSPRLHATLAWQQLLYNQSLLEGKGDMVRAGIGVAEITWRIRERHSLRTEVQALFTGDDRGGWIMALVEYSISPKWFFALSDQYNHGNPDPAGRQHYISASAGYTTGPTRIQLTWGRQREGILCVGGVCRQVPAMSGVGVSVVTVF